MERAERLKAYRLNRKKAIASDIKRRHKQATKRQLREFYKQREEERRKQIDEERHKKYLEWLSPFARVIYRLLNMRDAFSEFAPIPFNPVWVEQHIRELTDLPPVLVLVVMQYSSWNPPARCFSAKCDLLDDIEARGISATPDITTQELEKAFFAYRLNQIPVKCAVTDDTLPRPHVKVLLGPNNNCVTKLLWICQRCRADYHECDVCQSAGMYTSIATLRYIAGIHSYKHGDMCSTPNCSRTRRS